MGKINAKWHLANKMPKNPSLEQRRRWHTEHAKNCACRELTAKQKQQLGIK